MITRSPLRPHICLQCQRNLTKRILPSKSQSASFHPSVSNAEDQDSQSSKTPQFNIQRVAVLDRRRPKPAARKEREWRGVPRTQSAEKPGKNAAGKLHGHRGRKLQEKVEDLNTNSLGDAAKVIVLQDSKYNFYTHLHRMKDQAAKHVDIESVLEQEKGIVSVQEVNKSIDGLRKGQPPQTWEELNGFVRELSEGFTYSQLLRYLEYAYARTAAEVADDALEAMPKPSSSSPHILNVSCWMPSVSEVSDHFDEDPLRGYYLPSHTSKQKLALKIVRECWNWELPEISEGLGQFEVQMARSDLDLLSKGSDSPLTLLHSEYLAHEDEAMEVFPSRGIIRVTTMRHKLPIVVDILARDLDSIQRETVYLGAIFPTMAKGRDFMAWQDRTFSDEVLQELSQITNTEISRISKNTLLVSCFVNGDNPALASRIDTVKRLLTTCSDVADRANYALESNNLTDGMFIPYPQIHGLSWREKMREWVRWTVPVAKKSLNPNISKIAYPEKEEEIEEVEKSLELNEPPVGVDHPSWWKEFNDTSALFGSVLHTSLTPGRDLVNPFDSSISARRGFSSLVPNLTRLLQKTNFPAAKDGRLPTLTPLKFITIKFLPDPFQPSWDGHDSQHTIEGHVVNQGMGSQVLKHLPPVEMRFSVSEDNSIKLKDVLAIVSESKSDVMLPSIGVDIRFQHRRTRRLKHARNMEYLREFVTNSILDLQKGRMLTPPTINFPIDPDMLSSQDRRVLNIGKGKEPQKVQYMFAGLDVRSTLVFNWNHWRVLYTSIEAGQAGGRRGELRLRPIQNGTVASKKDFIKAANELAHELGDSTPDSELAFASPVLTSSYLQPDSVKKDTTGGDGKLRRNPALFGDNATSSWFIKQDWLDESWDFDAEEEATIMNQLKGEGGARDGKV